MIQLVIQRSSFWQRLKLCNMHRITVQHLDDILLAMNHYSLCWSFQMSCVGKDSGRTALSNPPRNPEHMLGACTRLGGSCPARRGGHRDVRTHWRMSTLQDPRYERRLWANSNFHSQGRRYDCSTLEGTAPQWPHDHRCSTLDFFDDFWMPPSCLRFILSNNSVLLRS
jgi:hypothetical protein